MTLPEVATVAWLILEYAIKVYAVGVVPENRRPSSSQAWLLLILLLPFVGLPLYFLIGSPQVRGRRHRVQAEANEVLEQAQRSQTTLPPGVSAPRELESVLAMNRTLTRLPCVIGRTDSFHGDTYEAYAAMTEAVEAAEQTVYVEFYIMAWDATTDPFFSALAAAVQRGVRVQLLMDHLGSRKYAGWGDFRRRLTEAGIEWHLMMPIDPLRGRWRRPDLRNHRKLLVVDHKVAFVGSHNVIDPHYGSARNQAIGREWKDLTVEVSGDIVDQVEAVFAVDWYTETGEVLPIRERLEEESERAGNEVVPALGGPVNALQIVPSGPGFASEPNLRMFSQLIATANERVSITSPYFVPDEALISVITTAAYRGVRVDLFVGEQSDQFFVGHAQRSYYEGLLQAGVRIFRYPAPTILHSKFLVVDDKIAAIGSSNMDYRSFMLDYEITLLGFGGDLVTGLRGFVEEYQAVSRELTLAEWRKEPWHQRYLDNVARLTSALM